jgi:HEAT repeat protein
MQAEGSNASLVSDLISGDEVRAEAAAHSLAQLGDSALAALEPLLDAKDADHRWWAVRTLGQMPTPRVDWLVRALADATSDVRAAAALALGARGAPEATRALVQALQDEDSIVGLLAVNALLAIGKSAVPTILEAFPTASARGRIQSMRALAELQDHSAIPVMMKAIEEDSAMLRYWAEQGLNRLGLDMVYVKPE